MYALNLLASEVKLKKSGNVRRDQSIKRSVSKIDKKNLQTLLAGKCGGKPKGWLAYLGGRVSPIMVVLTGVRLLSASTGKDHKCKSRNESMKNLLKPVAN